MHPELQDDIGKLIYAKEDLFESFPESVRPSNVTLQWGSPYSRSPLRVHTYNWTSTDMLFQGKKYWKLFPPEQGKYLYPDQGGILSGLALQCRLYTSPVDAFMPDYTRYPLYEKARPYIAEQRAGEVLITPPGWYMQSFYAEEGLGLSTKGPNPNPNPNHNPRSLWSDPQRKERRHCPHRNHEDQRAGLLESTPLQS